MDQDSSQRLINDRASQEKWQCLRRNTRFLTPSFDRVDPDLNQVCSKGNFFRCRKKLLEDVSLSVRFVKHLIGTIDDVGALEWVTDPVTGESTLQEIFYITNPGYGYSRPQSQGGKFADFLVTFDPDWVADPAGWAEAHPGANPMQFNWYWSCPKAKREYYAMNVTLKKDSAITGRAGLTTR